MSRKITDQMMREAIARIAGSGDGELLYRYLDKTLRAVAGGCPDAGHLTFNEGRRSFAAEIMGLMSEGIRGRDNVIAFAVAERRPDDVFRPRPGGRRVSPDTYVPGFDGPIDQSADDARPGFTVET